MTEQWPKTLVPVLGPMREDKLDGAAEGMGAWGEASRVLAAEGWVPPDMMTGLTLFLLGQQPRDPDKTQKIPGAAGGVAGGVWVRERFTIHRPLRREEVFTVSGESAGRHVHKGRRYGTTTSETRNAAGELAASNVTTGLLAYQVEEGLRDGVEGANPDDLQPVGPDWEAAARNPCGEQLRGLQQGVALGGYPVTVGIELMAARDTKTPDNPIHSDPELAKKAGLKRPIAGGSHVLAFPLEVIFQAVGPHALFHGAAFDVRWKAPVYADLVMYPHVRVSAVEDDRVVFNIEARLEDDAVAMTGTVIVPLAS